MGWGTYPWPRLPFCPAASPVPVPVHPSREKLPAHSGAVPISNPALPKIGFPSACRTSSRPSPAFPGVQEGNSPEPPSIFSPARSTAVRAGGAGGRHPAVGEGRGAAGRPPRPRGAAAGPSGLRRAPRRARTLRRGRHRGQVRAEPGRASAAGAASRGAGDRQCREQRGPGSSIPGSCGERHAGAPASRGERGRERRGSGGCRRPHSGMLLGAGDREYLSLSLRRRR